MLSLGAFGSVRDDGERDRDVLWLFGPLESNDDGAAAATGQCYVMMIYQRKDLDVRDSA